MEVPTAAPCRNSSQRAFCSGIRAFRYYTPEQMESFRKRYEEAAASGQDIAQQGTAAWNELLEQYRLEMEKGTDPADPRLQELEKRR